MVSLKQVSEMPRRSRPRAFYLVVPVVNIARTLHEKSPQKNTEDIRLSNDGTLCIFKFGAINPAEDLPPEYRDLETGNPIDPQIRWLTNSEAIELCNSDVRWIDPDSQNVEPKEEETSGDIP